MRPAVKTLLDNTIIALTKLVGWHITIPLLGRDYLTTGFVLFFSYFSARIETPKLRGKNWEIRERESVPYDQLSWFKKVVKTAFHERSKIIPFLLFWPLIAIVTAVRGLWIYTSIEIGYDLKGRRCTRWSSEHVTCIFIMLPFFYFGVLLGINYLLHFLPAN